LFSVSINLLILGIKQEDEAVMSGQAGARGYLLQSLICVLDAVDKDQEWLSLTIEPNEESEKVDIVWIYSERRKVVQVKSSKNPISLPSATKWANELEGSSTADEYELRLIGPCSTKITRRDRIGNVVLPTPENLNVESLIQQAAQKLDHYFYAKQPPIKLPPTAREIIVKAFAHQLGEYSTKGQELSRKDLDELLGSWVAEFQGTAFAPNNTVSADLRTKYINWIRQTSSAFYVPGLNVTMPIKDAWIRLKVMQDDKLIIGTKSSLDEQFRNYMEFGQRLQNTNNDPTVASDSVPMTNPRCVFVGGPGDGKSTMLKRFAWRLTGEQAIVVCVRLPVVLRNIMLAGRSFEGAVRLAGFDGSGIVGADAVHLLDSADYLLCDGLDECDPHRSRIADHIMRWSIGHSDCRICVTTRPVGHESAFLPDFAHFALLPPDERQVRELAKKLFEKSVKDDSYVDKWKLFMEAIGIENEVRHIQRLAARNPLLLGFMIRLSLDNIDIGKTRSELYSRVFDILTGTKPNDREVVEVNKQMASEVANALAWKQTQSPFCSSGEALSFVSNHVRIRFNLSILEADEATELGVPFWENQRLFETITAGIEAKTFFIHLSLQEFSAARFARNLKSSDFSNWILKMRRKPTWKQVILLLSGIDEDARTISALLDLDDPDDPVSCEAFLVSEALFERDRLEFAILPRLLESLTIRFQSDIPLVSIEATQCLAKLAPYAREQVLKISQVDTPNAPWADLGKLLLRVITDDSQETVEEFKKWFKNYSPVSVHLPKIGFRDESQLIPEEACDLQNQIIECGLERMIASHDKEDIDEYFQGLGERGDISSWLMSKIQKRLTGIGLPEAAKAIWNNRSDISILAGMSAASRRWNDADLNLLKLIIRVSGLDVPASSEPPFLVLSILLSGLGYWNSSLPTLTQFKDLVPDEDDVGAEVIRSLSVALELDINALGAEAQAALEYCVNDDLEWHNTIEQTVAEPKWSRLSDGDFNPNLIAQGILHSCSLISFCSGHAIYAGFARSEAAVLISTALESDKEHVLQCAAAIAESCCGIDAFDLILSRLKRPIYVAHKCLLRTIARFSSEKQRQSVIKCFFSWLTVDDPELATGIAEDLSEFDPPLSVDIVEDLRKVLTHWTERGTKCAQHDTVVKGSSCPKCSTVPPSPRSAILKELDRLGAVPFDELVQSCGDLRHDVSHLATSIIIERSTMDADTLSRVLDLVEANQLSPRILDKALKLPIEKNSALARKVETLLYVSDLGLRLATIGQLTGEWIDRDRAIKFLRSKLDDPEPTIRTLATRILRLLN